jgi:hypothetical protein
MLLAGAGELSDVVTTAFCAVVARVVLKTSVEVVDKVVWVPDIIDVMFSKLELRDSLVDSEAVEDSMDVEEAVLVKNELANEELEKSVEVGAAEVALDVDTGVMVFVTTDGILDIVDEMEPLANARLSDGEWVAGDVSASVVEGAGGEGKLSPDFKVPTVVVFKGTTVTPLLVEAPEPLDAAADLMSPESISRMDAITRAQVQDPNGRFERADDWTGTGLIGLWETRSRCPLGSLAPFPAVMWLPWTFMTAPAMISVVMSPSLCARFEPRWYLAACLWLSRWWAAGWQLIDIPAEASKRIVAVFVYMSVEIRRANGLWGKLGASSRLEGVSGERSWAREDP